MDWMCSVTAPASGCSVRTCVRVCAFVCLGVYLCAHARLRERACAACVLDPLAYPSVYCNLRPPSQLNGTIVEPDSLSLDSLEPHVGVPTASALEVLAARNA